MFKAELSQCVRLKMLRQWPGDQGLFKEIYTKLEGISVFTIDSQCNVPGLSHDGNECRPALFIKQLV